MGSKRDTTKELLAASLKEQMKRISFDKITIRMITDGAGVIRPTFYNHFHDKHELLEYIFKSQVVDLIYPYMDAGKEMEAAGIVFHLVYQDWDFYRKAFQVIGQNSFNSIVAKALEHMLYDLLGKKGVRAIPGTESLITERISVQDGTGKWVEKDLETVLISRYYAVSLANILDNWVIQGERGAAPEQMKAVYYYLVTHSFTDVVESNRTADA